MNKISDALALAGGNLARPTRFSALIAPPVSLNVAGTKVFDVLCKDVQVPDVTMDPIDMQFKGHTLKIPSRVNQAQTIDVTVYLDEHHQLRQMFNNWINGMDDRFYAQTAGTSIAMAQAKDYYGNLILKSRDFDETNSEPMNYLFEGVFPISVSGPTFGAASVNEVSEITITFAYFRMLSGDTSGNYDDYDASLSSFGRSAEGLPLNSFGAIGNLVSTIDRTAGSVGDAISAVGAIF